MMIGGKVKWALKPNKLLAIHFVDRRNACVLAANDIVTKNIKTLITFFFHSL
jgi:hypothetical protein